MTLGAKVRGALMPVPTAVPPSGSSPTRGKHLVEPFDCGDLQLGGVPAHLLAEGHRRGVHQMGAARLHDPTELPGLAGERRSEGARSRG